MHKQKNVKHRFFLILNSSIFQFFWLVLWKRRIRLNILLKKILHQPRNVLTLQLSLSLRVWNKFYELINFHSFICNFARISFGFRQLKWILCLFHRGKRFKGKLNICWGKQEVARTCSVYVSMLWEKYSRSNEN